MPLSSRGGYVTAALIKKRAGAFDLDGVFIVSLHKAGEFHSKRWF